MNKKDIVIYVLAISVFIFGAASSFVFRSDLSESVSAVSPEIAEALIRPHTPILGALNAPVTIYEFFDPACEACRAFHPILKDILTEHGDSVRIAVRYTPFHGEASVVAILILEAARAQGVYEEVLEAVLYEQPQWASHGNMRPELLLQIGERAGLNIEAALVHMQSASAMDTLNQDREDVMTVGVKQTPTFFVNGKPVEPFGEATLRALVAAEVSAQK